MRKQSKLKFLIGICAILFFFEIGCFSFANSNFGIVNGRVTDSHQHAVPGIRVILSNGNGQTWQTGTDNNGKYQFEGLRQGNYVLRIDPPNGWRVVSPNTGFYSFDLNEHENLWLDFLVTGVAIDFGKPPATGSGTIMDKTYDGQRHFRTMVRIRDIEQWEGDSASKMIIEGEWAIDGEPNAAIRLVDAQPQGPYSLGKVQFENLDGNRFRLVLETPGWPGLAYNGDVMVLDLVAGKGNPQAQLKVSTTRISFGNRASYREVPGVSGAIEQ